MENIGKVPLRAGRGLLEKKKLQSLKDELQRVIELEEYERAAEIRDDIREIQKGDGKNEKLDES